MNPVRLQVAAKTAVLKRLVCAIAWFEVATVS